MPSRLVMTNRVCQSMSNGACSVEKTVSPTTPAAVRASPPNALRRGQSRARSISARNFGSMMTTMQITKISNACAVPLPFQLPSSERRTVMFERPVYF